MCRVCGSFTLMTRSGAARRAMRQRPSVPSVILLDRAVLQFRVWFGGQVVIPEGVLGRASLARDQRNSQRLTGPQGRDTEEGSFDPAGSDGLLA